MAVSACISGILIDIDHLFDFLVFSREKFSIKGFFSWFYETRWEKTTILLHSYELYLVLCIVTFFYSNDILIGFLLGGGLHLMLDQIGVRNYGSSSPMYYFLAYRCSVGFQKNKMFINKQR
jgi:hypothetical protein